MFSKWLKKCLPKKDEVIHLSALQSIKHYLSHPNIWKMNCQSVALGVAIGLFASIIPIPQMLLAAILTIIFRGYLPIALLLTWISNPFTFLPINYLIYKTGSLITQAEFQQQVFSNISWTMDNIELMWNITKSNFPEIIITYLIGLVVVSLSFGFLGYLLVASICYIQHRYYNRQPYHNHNLNNGRNKLNHKNKK